MKTYWISINDNDKYPYAVLSNDPAGRGSITFHENFRNAKIECEILKDLGYNEATNE